MPSLIQSLLQSCMVVVEKYFMESKTQEDHVTFLRLYSQEVIELAFTSWSLSSLDHYAILTFLEFQKIPLAIPFDYKI